MTQFSHTSIALDCLSNFFNLVPAQAAESGNEDSAGMGPAFEEQTSHLQPTHAAFLSHWLKLVGLEEAENAPRRAELWTMPGTSLGEGSNNRRSEKIKGVPLLTHIFQLLSHQLSRCKQVFFCCYILAYTSCLLVRAMHAAAMLPEKAAWRK